MLTNFWDVPDRLNEDVKPAPTKIPETRENTFSDLLRRFETFYEPIPDGEENKVAEDLNADLLYSVSFAMVYSVIKKLLKVSGNNVIYSLRSDLFAEQTRQAILAYLDPMSYTSHYNASGELRYKNNPAIDKVIISNLRKTAGDGVDLVHDGIVQIMDEVSKVEDRSIGYLERPYSIRCLKKKVRIKDDESVGGWETTETTPIQEIFRYIRNRVSVSSSVKSASDKYTYLEELSTNPETGWEEVVYRRLSKYSQLADYVYDFNGAPTVVVAVGEEDYTNIEETVAAMGLTAREAAVLKYRLSGYGNKAIATMLGLTENSVKGARNTIKKKAKRIGLDPAMTELKE